MLRITLSLLLALLILSPLEANEDYAQMVLPKEKKPAPVFSLVRLEGKEFSLSQAKGKVVLLNFWATWCGPCVKEMASLEKLYQEFGDQGLVLIAINENRGSVAVVEKFQREHNLSFPILLDPRGVVRKLYEVDRLPITYLLDRQGRFLGRIDGERDWNHREMRKLIEALLQT